MTHLHCPLCNRCTEKLEQIGGKSYRACPVCVVALREGMALPDILAITDARCAIFDRVQP